MFTLYIKMKITNIRSEDLVEIITNNDLTEQQINWNYFKPTKYKHNPSLKQLSKTNGEETHTVRMNNIYYIELNRQTNTIIRNWIIRNWKNQRGDIENMKQKKKQTKPT